MKEFILPLMLSLIITGSIYSQNNLGDHLDRYREKTRLLSPIMKSPLKNLNVGTIKIDSFYIGKFEGEEITELRGIQRFSYNGAGNLMRIDFDIWSGPDIGFIPFTRTLYTFDNTGRSTQWIEQERDFFTGFWQDIYRNTTTYSESGLLIEDKFEAFRDSTQGWVIEYLLQNEYSPANQIISSTITENSYSTDFEFKVTNKTTYQYDFIGNEILRASFKWDSFEDKLLPVDELRFYYDTHNKKNNLVADSKYTWDNNESVWNKSDTSAYFYNEDNLVIAQYLTRTYFSNEQITLDSLFYDNQKRLVEKRNFYRENESALWVKHEKSIYSYENESIPFLMQNYIWEADDSSWSVGSKQEMLLDRNSNVLSHTRYIRFDGETRPWDLFEWGRREDILLSDLDPISQLILETYVFNEFDVYNADYGPNAVSRYAYYDWNGVDWEYYYSWPELRFFYSAKTTAATQNKLVEFKLYPNPTSNFLYLETDLSHFPIEMSLYTMDGRQIFRKIISNNGQIVLPEVTNGIYLLQLSKGHQFLGSKRILIKK